jgi:hypothetical protein
MKGTLLDEGSSTGCFSIPYLKMTAVEFPSNRNTSALPSHATLLLTLIGSAMPRTAPSHSLCSFPSVVRPRQQWYRPGESQS